MKSTRRKMAWPRHTTTYLCMTAASALLLLLTLLAPSPLSLSSLSSSSGLVAAQGVPFFKKQPVPDPAQVAAKKQAIARLKALKSSSSSSSAPQENTDTNNNNDSDNDDSSNDSKKLRVSKGKGRGIEGLLNVVVAGSSSSPLPPTDDITTITSSNENNDGNSDHKAATSNAQSAPSIDSDFSATGGGKGERAADPAANQKILKTTGHEDDIIHEHDHADNDAYDDIVWYDGPHRDDEDEHGDDHHDDDHHDDENHHDDNDDEHFEDHHHDDEDHEEGQQGNAGQKISRVKRDASGAATGSSESLETTVDNMSNSNSNHLQQRILNSDNNNNNNNNPSTTSSGHQHEHSAEGGGGGGDDPTVFHHSGAEVLVGPISPVEFCLRLKHECESTCREFRSQVLHVSTSCEFGSVAELLLWGKCCQVGQVNRKKSPSARVPRQPLQQQQQPIAVQDSSSSAETQQQGEESTAELSDERHDKLVQKHLEWQQKRHAAQQERERELFLQPKV